MEVHDTTIAGVTATATASATAGAAMRRTFLIINCIILSIGNCGGPLIMRLYYVRGGKRIWFSSWLQTGGLPIILLPLLYSYTHRRNTTTNPNFFLMKPRVCIAAAVIGILIGLDNYLYAYGVAKLPISTSTLIVATQLVFTATFSYLLVKQKFTAYSINAVVLLTLGAVVLGVHASGDRPEGVSNKEYWLGFFLTVAAAALYGFILPMVELMYKKAKQEVKYTVVMEVQLVMCFIATAFCTVGMIINNDFQAISREAKEYEIGATKYYMVVVFAAIIWQCYFLGAIGVIFYSSSFLSGVIVTVLLSITEVLAVILFSEKFHAEKGISLFLSLWGFVSYFFGEIKQNRKNNKENLNEDQTSEVQTSEVQLAHQDSIP